MTIELNSVHVCMMFMEIEDRNCHFFSLPHSRHVYTNRTNENDRQTNISQTPYQLPLIFIMFGIFVSTLELVYLLATFFHAMAKGELPNFLF
jgi:hypothetical protein